MTHELTIWHNPRCSKSRKTLELLKERGFKPTIRKYLEDPPSRDELDEVLEALDFAPRELIRTKEPEYEELELADSSRNRDELLTAIAAHPKLIQRPIVITSDGRAKIGRPPKSVLSLIDPG